jgi:hypothetical protein
MSRHTQHCVDVMDLIAPMPVQRPQQTIDSIGAGKRTLAAS